MRVLVAFVLLSQWKPSEEIVDPVQPPHGPYRPPRLCDGKPLVPEMCFVPPRTFSPDPEQDLPSRDLISTVLGRAEEPNLWKSREGAVIRCTILPTTMHPVVIRASASGTGGAVALKILSGEGGYAVGDLLRSSTGKLSASDWRSSVGLLAEQRREDASPKPERSEHLVSTGGTWWFVEYVAQGKYGHWEFWRPNEDNRGSPLAKMCKQLVRLAKEPSAVFVLELK